MKRIILRYLLVVSVLCLGFKGYSQTSTYNYTVLSGTFSDISGTGTVVNGSSSPMGGTAGPLGTASLDRTVTNVPIGFTFYFCGTPYTQLSASNHMWLSLANTLSYIYVNTAGNIPSAGTLMFFWDDMGGTGSNAYYQTTGTTPNRVFTIQYTDWNGNPWPWTSGSGVVDCQVKLYEGTNVIEYWYGPGTLTGLTATIGIANSTSDYKTVNSGFATATYMGFYGAHSAPPSDGVILRWSQCAVPATAANSGPACPGSTITLTGTTTGSAYSWTGPAGFTSTLLTPTITASSTTAGVYVFSATNGTCTTTASTTVSLNPVPATPVISPSTAVTICNGASVALTSSAAATWSPTTYLFTDAAFTVPYTGSTVSTVYVHPTTITTPTVITYTATVTNGFGCTASATKTVTMNPAVASITGVLSVCNGYSTTLSSSSPGGTWSSLAPGIATVVPTTGVVTGASVGTATIIYTVAGCSSVAVVTITPTPGSITGILIACLGSTTTLSNSLPGGTWSSSAPGVASVGSSSGIVTGVTLGTATITYDMGSGCYSTATVTVNPYPAAITGSPSVCVGACTVWSSATSGGLWTSSAPGVATVGIVSGNVCGVSLGTATISYRVAGCSVTQVMTVVSAAAPIVGPTSVCIGSNITLSNSTPGGSWVSSTPAVATIGSSTGILTGVSAGTTTITYALSAGCTSTMVVTVTAAPAPIGGTLSVCEGLTTTLTHPVAGGTWASSTPAIASIGLGTGVVTGVSATPPPGTTTITYTLPSTCFTTSTFTVLPLPASITGTMSMCVGQTTTLSSATPGGTWSSGTTGVATIGSTTGIVTGITAGSSIITYTLSTGCQRTSVVSVNAAPAAITGTATVCVGQTTALSDATPFGAWSSSTPAVGTVSGAGVVTGISGGTTTITYTLATTCYATRVVTVNNGPTAITGNLGMCVGTCTTLNSTPAGGAWSSSAPGVVSVVGPGGFSCGSAAGTATISYTVSGCSATAIATVYALPGTISGPTAVCVGQTITLTNSSAGGTWSCTVTGGPTASIDATTGVLTGLAPGTTIVTYSLGTGCTTTATITINGNPTAINGGLPIQLCEGISTTLTSTPSGGTWFSSTTSVATIGVGTGLLNALTAGTTSISYTLPTGCRVTTVVSVNGLPTPITGGTSVCVGQCTTLSSGPAGGTWSSSNGNATVNPATGVTCGVFAGTSTISYSMPSGCYRTVVVLVSAPPSAISGTPVQLCEASTVTLTGTPAGGTWISSTPAVGTIGLGSGILGCLTSGTTTVTYTLPTTCALSTVATCNPLPTTITGTPNTCVGQCTTLASTSAGGTWASSTPAVGTVNATGTVCGVSAGTTNITYTLPTGCRRVQAVTIFALPGIITGNPNVCEGSTTTLSCTPIGGTWTTSAPGIATVGPTTGIVSGITPGTATVTYTVGTGCTRTTTVTVNANPNPVTGTLTTCVGQATTLSSTTPGGGWTSLNTAVATVGATTGVVSGISGIGTATIVYTVPTTCTASAIVTVYALPANIGGSLQVCENSTTTLTTTTPGGTWASTTPAVGTIDATTGVLTGIAAGTTTITYTLGSGCYKTAVATVNPLPLPITGTLQVCEGGTTTLTNFTGGGGWSSNPTTVATVGAGTGVVTGVSGTNTAVISYTLPTGCRSMATVTVFALPTTLTGPAAICKDETAIYTSTPPGGTWSSPSGNVSVNPVSGAVTGMNAGTALISYTQGIGCTRTATVIVNPLPNTITGNPGVCIGFTTLLATTSTGGNWSSTNTSVATIAPSGLVTSASIGTTTISYTFTATGCASTQVVTVNDLPTPIMGSDAFCNLSSSLYTSSPTGGTWTSADPSILTIDPVTGLATGVDTFATDIIYTLPTGCSVSKNVYLIVAPYPIGGPPDVCLGQTATLTNIIGGGVWSSSNSTILPVTPATSTTATVTGLNTGVATITYQLSTTGCYSTKDMTVNPIPGSTTGPTQVCEGSCTTLVNLTPGGTWMSSDVTIATIGSSTGTVCGISGGTAILSYALGTGCNAQFIMTVDPLPGVITGNPQVCEGLTTALSSTPSGGNWTSANPSVAYVDPSTGVVTGISAMSPGIGGTGITTITYTLPTGCTRTQDVTVNPNPTPITGIVNICVGDVTTVSNATPGGGWISSDPSIATIDASGNITGITPGCVIITYMLPTGCIATWPFCVNANPLPITGNLTLCAGFSTNLYSGPAGGTWSQDPASLIGGPTGIGYIHPITGVVSAWTTGTIPVTYSLSSGCMVVDVVTVVNTPPVITGPPQVCVGSSVTLSNAAPGGVWSSSNPARASVDATTGIVNGLTAGTVTISYTVGTPGTCFNVLTMTVNPLPAPITGPLQVCEGSQITLASASTGGFWISGNTSVATAGYMSGVITGILAGTADITYTLPAGGCMAQVTVTVNQTPPAIVGNPHVCMGASNTFTNAMAGGSWLSSNPAVATISTTGVVTSVSLGTAIITYQLLTTGCMATRQITVQPLPVVYTVTVTGSNSYCAGGTGVQIGLSGSQIGVSYALYHGSSAVGYVTGTGSAISFGYLTPAGVYTVQATNITSGCTRNMAGSATVIVTPLITPVVTIAASPTDSVCPGETVIVSPVTTTGGTAPTYIWKVNGTTVASTPTYSFIPANGDVVSVVMTSNASCLAQPTGTGTKTLTVLPTALPVAGVTTDPNDTVCQYNPVTFTANPSYGGSSPGYAWSVNGSMVGTGPTYMYVPLDGDVVSLSMTSNYRCRTATTVTSGDITMSVDSLRIPHVTIYPDPGFVITKGNPVLLHAVATDAGPNPKYQWKVNGHAIPGATLADYTAIFNDYDSITCMVISSGVCANIGTHDWVFITVIPLNTQPQTGAVGSLQLVPNPNKGLFTIKGTLGSRNNETVNIEVTDMLGQVVYRGTMESKLGKVDGQVVLDNTLANGIYLLTLRTETEKKVFHFVMEQ